ncbi:monovalent cation:proton antiporter family protein [Phaeocystidibacter marisrubri]|uniref:Potassium transporter KefB n=1 Tax=Phaeocystidibacter marisrubri TaxID=1577780 RepID=A0A6L3ZJT7_9FLAO|nr:monovalent cation:proton antiporter family protein [Phaeocystidibacter marisrubri]KAB2817818.1 potassium transporter KefB [Phaeocystidibacter marisrubri]
MELPMLTDIVIILGISVPLILLFQRFRLPSILGLLLAGIIVGPSGLSLVHSVHDVEVMSEIGVIFLLFVIGIEFSLGQLAQIKRTVFVGGSVQMFLTIAVVTGIAVTWGLDINKAIFMGFLFALSSTAIVLKLLQEQGAVHTPHGRVAVAILIFQDIMVVPLMLVTPMLAGQSENWMLEVGILLIKVLTVIAITWVLARYVVPFILDRVVRTKNKELFILTLVVICFATAWMTSAVGLSLALGAFFAGLIISESSYSHQATANILPFREIFISFFFVSIGMLLDIGFFFTHIHWVILLSVATFMVKGIVSAIAAAILRYPARTVILSGMTLFQVGEFAFVLSAAGLTYNLLSEEAYQLFLAVSILTMAGTPFVMKYEVKISDRILRRALPRTVRKRLDSIAKLKGASEQKNGDELKDHLIIIGYGINGKNVAKAARSAEIPYVILELDPDLLEEAKADGQPIHFGDATDNHTLSHFNLPFARVIVIAISDQEATRKILKNIRMFTETAHVIVRTRHVKEIEQIVKLGADEVIPEEFETSIEIFTKVLRKYLIPTDEIEAFTNQIRSGNYQMLRSAGAMVNTNSLSIPELEIATLRVYQMKNDIVGKTLVESNVRVRFGLNILAIQRGNRYLTNLTPDTTIEQDDLLYVVGAPNQIASINQYFNY